MNLKYWSSISYILGILYLLLISSKVWNRWNTSTLLPTLVSAARTVGFALFDDMVSTLDGFCEVSMIKMGFSSFDSSAI